MNETETDGISLIMILKGFTQEDPAILRQTTNRKTKFIRIGKYVIICTLTNASCIVTEKEANKAL